MKSWLLWILCALSTPSVAVASKEKPPIPFYNWLACPFECCTYRNWKAEHDGMAYKARSQKSAVAFQIKKGQWVHAIDGVVITEKFGVSKILKPVRLGHLKNGTNPVLSLKPGELVYTLHYLGEGYELFWYKGKVYSDQIAARQPDPDPPPPELGVQALSVPRYVWWVKVRNKAGEVGWTDEPHKFGNVDACG